MIEPIKIGKGQYACPLCPKVAEAYSKIMTHLVVHTRERNFSCHLCTNAFSTKGSLMRHMRKLHLE